MADEPRVTETALEKSGPSALVSQIMQIVQTPGLGIDVAERLLAMSERVMENQRKVAFSESMARLQAKLPQIKKDGRIVVKGTERSRYARIEDIDVAIRPLMAEEGFSFSFDSDSNDAKLFKLSCKLSHKDGHSETKYLTLPIDQSDYRSNVQSIGSTVSYGKRQLIKMHLNLVEHGEDDDGAGGSKLISDVDVKIIEAAITDLKMNRGKFLIYMGVGDVKDILARDLKKAQNAIDTQRDALKNKKKGPGI